MPASLGISLPNRGVLFGAITVEEILDMSEVAERSGAFDSVWVGDSLLAKPRVEAIAILSAIAGRTCRVQLGTACMASFPYRDPLLLALQWASLDLVSGGRSVLCVCAGASGGWGMGESGNEVKAIHFNPSERLGRFEEGIEVVRRLWHEDHVTHHGQYYQYEDVTLQPRPAQRPCPIWIAVAPIGLKPELEQRAYRRVARLADGWMTARHPTPDELRRRIGKLDEALREAGRSVAGYPVSYHMMINLNDDAQKGWEEGVAFLAKYYGPMEEWKLRIWLAPGPPEEVARRIQEYIDAGCTLPILRFASWDGPGQLRRFIDEVRPRLRMEAR
jgi:alkanesulfonate monooxygenase SsuD/methylene tetrahydromethanopterin reductase-like flavin-dependent oxidoreductase (luciferase family)